MFVSGAPGPPGKRGKRGKKGDSGDNGTAVSVTNSKCQNNVETLKKVNFSK